MFFKHWCGNLPKRVAITSLLCRSVISNGNPKHCPLDLYTMQAYPVGATTLRCWSLLLEHCTRTWLRSAAHAHKYNIIMRMRKLATRLLSQKRMEERINKARGAFFAHRRLGSFHDHLNLLSSRSLIQSCVMPVLMYGFEFWRLNRHHLAVSPGVLPSWAGEKSCDCQELQ